MKTDVPIKAAVRCDDGVAGTMEAVIVDPVRREIAHLVLRQHRFPHTQRLVPVDLIAWTTEDEIHLRGSIAAVETLDSFIEDQFVEAPEGYRSYPIAVGAPAPYLFPFTYPQEKVLVSRERISDDELAIRSNLAVDATDGRVGRVEAFLVEKDNGRITHIVVRSGHLARREFAVPVSDVTEISKDRIALRLDRRGVGHLPRVPYRKLSRLLGIDEADDDLVPEPPRNARIPEEAPDESHMEGAHLLAQEVGRRLEARGFTRDQILDWADAYLAADRTGGSDGFVSWIDDEEHR